jgi:hypothetical protein
MTSYTLKIAVLALGLTLGAGTAIAQSSGGGAAGGTVGGATAGGAHTSTGGANVGSSLPGGSNSSGMLAPGTGASTPGTITGEGMPPTPGSNSTVGNSGVTPLQPPDGGGHPCSTALNGTRALGGATTSSPPIAPPTTAVNPDCPQSDLPGVGANSTVAPPSTIGGTNSPSRVTR